MVIYRIQRGDQPRTIGVRLFLGGTVVAENVYQPKYEVSEPNGPGCGKQVVATTELETP